MQRWGDSLEAGWARISDGACNRVGSIRQDPWAPALGIDWRAVVEGGGGMMQQDRACKRRTKA